jgi:cellulose synthase/poly-beta-1,6-N-acetylglucosamine synthase-like glycosyltransferase
LDNFENFKGNFKKHFLQCVALLQSKWTLSHELPRLINQSESKFGNCLEGAHVVGHGLCIRLDILAKVNYFPISFINEDLPLGYLLRLSGEIIYPLPLLENAQSPTTIRSMFNQYKTWFYGVIYYPQYLYRVLIERKYRIIKAFIWAFRYSVRAIVWLFTSVVWVFLFIYPILIKNYLFLTLSLFIFSVYAPLSFYLIENILNKDKRKVFLSDFDNIKISFLTYFMSVPVYLTHSWGPILALKEIFMSIFFGRKINKQKTER